MPMESVHDQAHARFSEVRAVHAALVPGDLALAKQHGAALQRLTAEGELGGWDRDRAEAFADTMDVCASCHAISRTR